MKSLENTIRSLFRDGPSYLQEDGHTDVASMITKLQSIAEDAQQLQEVLQAMDKESSLPTWLTNKIAVAGDHLNSARDYLVNQSEDNINNRKT